MRTQDNMRNWCGITDPAENAKQSERFESLIVENARRLQDMGKTGLVILPGVKDLLESVSRARAIGVLSAVLSAVLNCCAPLQGGKLVET